MLWGVRLYPGQESKHIINNQLHLTLASLDCRPGNIHDGSAAYLLIKTLSCENFICTLEKGQTNQQRLDLVLQPGEQVTFKVEGNGHVCLTGYSWIGPETTRDIPNVPHTRSAYTGLLPSSQDKAISRQHLFVKKSAEQQNKLPLRKIRQVQDYGPRAHNPHMSSDNGWILEEHLKPMRKDGSAANSDLNNRVLLSEELDTVGALDVEEGDECIGKNGSVNEVDDVEAVMKLNERNRKDEERNGRSGESCSKVELPDATCVEMTNESDERARGKSGSEGHGESHDIDASIEEVQCTSTIDTKGESVETKLHGDVQAVLKVEPCEEDSNENLPSHLNDTGHDRFAGESIQLDEKDSFGEPVTDDCGSDVKVSKMSQDECEESDGIFTIVVEDVNTASTESERMTDTMSGTDQAQTKVHEAVDNSGKFVLFQCQICDKSLPSKESLNLHKESHFKGNQNTPKAQYCKEENRSSVFTQHNQRTVEETDYIHDQQLNNDFRRRSPLMRFEDVHKPSRLLHECQYCGKVVTTKASLKVHLKLHPEHTGETNKTPDESLRCQLCGKYFSNISNRRRHEKMHTNGRSFKCNVCGKQLQNKWFLNEHLRMHTQETLLKCQFCDKMFRGEENRKRHEKIHLDATGPYECRFCGKTFESASGGRRHEAMHTGNRAYKCRFCDKTFNDRRCRESHEGRLHTGERLHNCPICVKSFYGKGDLDVHMRVHTGEKPYKCRYCDELFTYHTSARRHEARHVEGSTLGNVV